MREHEPTTQTMKISDLKDRLSSLVNRVYRKEARVLVEKSGIPVAALVSADDLARLTELDEQRSQDFAVIDRMREAFSDVPEEEIGREAARSLADARRRRRQHHAGAEPEPATGA